LQSDSKGFPVVGEGSTPPERLADRLADGRLPLDEALGCAADLAVALRELHASGRVHGSVTPVFVALEPARALLLPAQGVSADASKQGDIAAFGAVLYEMLVGRKPASDAFGPAAFRSPYGPAWTRVYQTSLHVAEKCLAASADTLPDLRNIATEIRLLLVIARRPEAPPAAAPRLRKPEPAADPKPTPPEEVETANVTLTDLVCPCCGVDDVHISGRRTGFERFLAKFDVTFFRCHRCFHRFMIIFGVKITMVSPL
jgi:hypothetical protein